jgi:N-hydroxyarylamine O-acetyltransferase
VTTEEARLYLARIGHVGPATPSLALLRDLHRLHLRAVPFENLAVRAGTEIRLDEPSLFAKIVSRRRGGFCYELNGLFGGLLRTLGFPVAHLAGRVGVDGIPFDHMALRVELDEPWLADVGFGDSFLEPIRLGAREPQDGGDGRGYLLAEHGDGLLLSRLEPDGWKRQYLIDPGSWPVSAFEGGCHHHRTSPLSSFTQRTVVTRATEDGRITLSEHRLIVTVGGERTEMELPDDASVARVLADRFGLGPETVR